MDNRLSINNPVFDQIRQDFDRYLGGTVKRTLEINEKECSVSLKVSIDLAGCDDYGQMRPDIKYKISASIPISGSSKNRVHDDCVMEPTDNGLELRKLTEQTSML